MKSRFFKPQWIALSILGAGVFFGGYAIGQTDTNADMTASQSKLHDAYYQASWMKAFREGLRRRNVVDEKEFRDAYEKDGDSFIRRVEAHQNVVSDPATAKEAKAIGLRQAEQGDNGPLLLTQIELQQKQIEQNEKIISLLQDLKDKK